VPDDDLDLDGNSPESGLVGSLANLLRHAKGKRKYAIVGDPFLTRFSSEQPRVFWQHRAAFSGLVKSRV
jgi:hypothetical protein